MTMMQLADILGVGEWPAAYHGVFERFCGEWQTIKQDPLLDWEAVDELVRDGYIDPNGLEDVRTCLRTIESDEGLAFALQCVYYALCEYRGPHENELYIDPAPPVLGDYRFTFPMIILMKCLIKGVKQARQRGIPEEMLAQMKGAANGDRLESGVYGTPNMFHWRVVCAFATMYFVGLLRYEPERVPEGYRMMRRKSDGKLLMLYTAQRSFDEYGQFTFDPALTVFSSPAAVGKTDGCLIAPDGRVLDRYVSLSSEEWETVFDGGDTALSFHIPSDCVYRADTIADSFAKAAAFFGQYFPEYAFKSIQSYSWLYSPQLRFMLSENSGINRLNKELYLAPVPSGAEGFYHFVFHTGEFDVDTASTDTSLKRGFVSFVKDGGRVHNGFMFLPIEDADRFSEHAHELYAYDMF